MKKCKTCGENFEDKYAFCPLDGTPLRESFAFEPREFSLTLIGDLRIERPRARSRFIGQHCTTGRSASC